MGKGIRKLRVVSPVQEEEQPQQAQPEPDELPEEEQLPEPTELQKVQMANSALLHEMRTLGAEVVGLRQVQEHAALEAIVDFLCKAGLCTLEEFSVQTEIHLNVMLERALEQAKEQNLARERQKLLEASKLEIARGPGVIVPKRLHG